jgi:hypothetical protein
MIAEVEENEAFSTDVFVSQQIYKRKCSLYQPAFN